jgi:uncharacterized peroxidase-related enzyme
MARLRTIQPESATGRARELLDTVEHKLGLVPNMARAMANSPAALDGYLQLGAALAKGTLSARVREQIALAVAEANGCDYCLAAHTALARAAGLTAEQARDARRAAPVDPRTAAVVRFARRLIDVRGRVSAADLAAVRSAGWDDGAIAEVIANVALHVFTNYFNVAADTDLDFPAASPLSPEPAAV